MGTISDKLMRIINTKEDIRQALISKGYDVPTSIPFKEYAKMISDLPCKVDDFPKLPGDVTRWHFGGLTNEMMTAMDDPRIEDADHKGRFLSFKNFAWSGMSGVGGYVQDFNYFRNNTTVDKVRIDEQSSNSIKVTILNTEINNAIYIPKNIYQFNKSYFIKISSEGYDEGDMALSFYAPSTSTATTVTVSLNPNGITEIPAIKEDDFLAVYINVGGKVGSITIEQLPLYPGFILGDGVDDFAVTEKELNFEDTYTVYTAFIPFQNNPKRNMILCGADSKKTFSMQYSSLVYVSFIAGNNYYINAIFVNGLNLFACKRNGNNICIKNLLTNKVVTGTCGDWVENAGLYYLWKNATYASFARAGIAGQIINNGHFTTDEEDENILNWHKKQYPWLFPDQAWTVVGKTNEDEDRATIANITGNGNNLVLSNFGFAEGSGYGSYFWNFKNFQDWNTVTEVTNSKIVLKGSASNFWGSQIVKTVGEELHIVSKVKVTGLTDEMPKLYFGKFDTGDKLQLTNGINNINKIIFAQYGWYGFGFEEAFESCNVTIEQIPEYEGYLVTDGVDDIVASSSFELDKKFTVVGEWKFINNESKRAGIVFPSKLYAYNEKENMLVYINTPITSNTIQDIRGFKALTSDGKLYDNNWEEHVLKTGDMGLIRNTIIFGGFIQNSAFTQMAFKDLGIYNNKILSKEDCIKAYNYLQTIKSK